MCAGWEFNTCGYCQSSVQWLVFINVNRMWQWAKDQVTSSQQVIHSRTPTEFVRSVFDGCRDMDTLCPPVRSNFLHAKHMPRWREDDNKLNLPISRLLALVRQSVADAKWRQWGCSQTRLKLDILTDSTWWLSLRNAFACHRVIIQRGRG